MAQELATLGPAESETEAKRNIVEAVKVTAKRLGNRPAACRKYYIHPAILESYIGQTMFEEMKGVHTSSGSSAAQLRAEELVVLRLVEAYASSSADRPAKAT
jgi:DNA topoisomerase I